MYTFERGTFSSSSFARLRERLEQDFESLGRLGMADGRVQSRQIWVRQDVDRLRGLRGDPVGLGVHAQLPHERGRLRPVRGLICEGR